MARTKLRLSLILDSQSKVIPCRLTRSSGWFLDHSVHFSIFSGSSQWTSTFLWSQSHWADYSKSLVRPSHFGLVKQNFSVLSYTLSFSFVGQLNPSRSSFSSNNNHSWSHGSQGNQNQSTICWQGPLIISQVTCGYNSFEFDPIIICFLFRIGGTQMTLIVSDP